MKKNILVIIILFFSPEIRSQSWVPVSNSSPVYSFYFPSEPTVLDTLNLKFYYNKPDSVTSLQVIEFKDTPFDSNNVNFNNALVQNGGDTLRAIVSAINSGTNSTLISSQNITSYNQYFGLESTFEYSVPYEGKVILSYSRFFYSRDKRTLLAFTISGFQDDLAQLNVFKNIFFNSITL